MAEEELPPSKLGTKEHWDNVYERENRVFEDIGDEGEVWFGESSVTKMRTWAQIYLARTDRPLRILECGSGNGTLLLSFLTSIGQPQPFHLTGIDYSPGAITLAKGVEAARREALLNGDVNYDDDDDDSGERVINPVEVEWRVGDLLRDHYEGEEWDLVLDKGTFDALALSRERVKGDGRLPSLVYPEKISKLVKEGGFFLITSCNFTEEEIQRRYTKPELGFTFHSSVPHPTFSFGGKKGSTICTVAFQKTSTSTMTVPQSLSATAQANSVSTDAPEPLYLCVDCGGTKTDVAIATSSRIVSRAVGGTSNMAEVGLQLSYEAITATVLDAVNQLPPTLKPESALASVQSSAVCPIKFADIWIGISGCDTPLDQNMMSDLLSPFFSHPSLPILNDAHLLGGALLTHQCPWGIAVIAGTGSVAIALEQTENGEIVQIARRGGLGYVLGDDGSAYDLGRWAIRHAVNDFDAGEEVEDGLAKAIRDHFKVEQTGDILAKVHELDPTLSPIDATNLRKLRLSSLSRLILEAFAADPPDPLAVRAVKDATGLLASSIVSLTKQLSATRSSFASTAGGSEGRSLQDAALIMGGGLIRQASYRRALLEECALRGVRMGVEEVVRDVAGEGAMGLAMRAKSKAAKLSRELML